MTLATLCAAPGCTRVILVTSKTGVCRDHMHHSGACRCRQCADPEFAAKNAARMKALNADPEFNPLAALTPEQRADYDTLRSKGGYTREEALAAVMRDKAQ